MMYPWTRTVELYPLSTDCYIHVHCIPDHAALISTAYNLTEADPQYIPVLNSHHLDTTTHIQQIIEGCIQHNWYIDLIKMLVSWKPFRLSGTIPVQCSHLSPLS